MSRPRVLVTGATGFIGRALISRLIRDYEVTLLLLEEFAGVTPLPPPLRGLRQESEVVYADLRNFQVTARAVRQAAPIHVIHLAAAGTTDPFLSPHVALRHNVTGTLHLLQACFNSGLDVRQLITARTPGEYSATNTYAASKAAAWAFCEMYARTAGWPIHGAMIFQAYGPGQPQQLLVPAALRAALAAEDFPMTEGKQEKDWIFIDDIVDGLVRLLGQSPAPGTTIELGTGRATAVREVVAMIYALVGRGGSPQFGRLPTRPGEETRQVADVSRLRDVLGWLPAISLADGLAKLLKYFPEG